MGQLASQSYWPMGDRPLFYYDIVYSNIEFVQRAIIPVHMDPLEIASFI
jgi:hypothetical protein